MQAPEGYSLDGVCVFAEQGEEFCVFSGLPFEDFGRARGIVRIVFREFFAVLAILSPPFASRYNVYIQLGYDHFKAEALYEVDCCFQVFIRDSIEFEVALDSHRVYGGFAFFEVLQEPLELLLFGHLKKKSLRLHFADQHLNKIEQYLYCFLQVFL